MAQSIIQSERECFITGSTTMLHKHHIFGGTGRRQLSEKYGLTVYLRYDWHNGEKYGVHFNKDLDTRLKRIAQEKAMKHYGWTVEEWIEIFGRNFL